MRDQSHPANFSTVLKINQFVSLTSYNCLYHHIFQNPVEGQHGSKDPCHCDCHFPTTHLNKGWSGQAICSGTQSVVLADTGLVLWFTALTGRSEEREIRKVCISDIVH